MLSNISFNFTPHGVVLGILMVFVMWLAHWCINQISFIMKRLVEMKLIIREVATELKGNGILSTETQKRIVAIEEEYGRDI